MTLSAIIDYIVKTSFTCAFVSAGSVGTNGIGTTVVRTISALIYF